MLRLEEGVRLVKPWGNRTGRSLLAVLLGLSWLGTASAHNIKLDLTLWGNFGVAAACQEVIGRAAAQCVARAVSARRTCREAELGGAPCNEGAMDTAVQAARIRALGLVEAGCATQQLNGLGFVDLRDAENDVISACRELDTAAESAVYGPALSGSAVGAVGKVEQACMEQAGTAVAKLLRFAFQARRQAFDRMAAADLTLGEKQALLRRSERRIARRATGLQRRVQARCGEAEFAAIYRRGVQAFLEGLAQRADCLVGWTYAQAAVPCPPALCGNGIKEPGEECDDGNTLDGDLCPAGCVRSM